MSRAWIVGALAALIALGPVAAQPSPPPVAELPGFVDFARFGELDPGDLTIEINLSGALLSMLATALEEEDDEFARLVRTLRLVKVNVFETAGTEESRTRAAAAIGRLRAEGWEAVVSIRDEEDLDILVRTDGERIQGLLATFGGERSFGLVNIVGELDPAQIGRLARQLGIEPLEDLDLQGRRPDDQDPDR